MLIIEVTEDCAEEIVVASLVDALKYCLDPKDKKHLKKTLKYYTTQEDYAKLKEEWN